MPTVKRNASARPQRNARTAKPKSARDPVATRAALIDAACEIFKGAGYFATDTNAIARAAGYAPGSFYNHFPDKTAILLAVYERYAEIEWGLIMQATKRGETRVRLRAALRVVNALHAEWSVFRADLRALAERESRVAAALQETLEPQLEAIAALAGLDLARQAAQAILIRMIVQRLAEAMESAEALKVSRAAVLRAAEDAIMALMGSAEAVTARTMRRTRPPST
ncbi:MAG: TetR/AcrR family transcriptional regulator [Alphaproteobacteria bacterium]|nr:TetR/AcrR family transcriptional regulator [Alphaproteobacteria bacterium]